MDPLFTDYVNWQPREPHRLMHVLKSNFDASYNGNRAPFPLFLHAYWHSAANFSDVLARFIGECNRMRCRCRRATSCSSLQSLPADDVARLPDVYFVTMRQLIGWMQRPMAAQELRDDPHWLGCGTPGGGTLRT